MPLFKLVLLICDQERNIRIPHIRDESISNGQDRSREKVIIVISETISVAANTSWENFTQPHFKAYIIFLDFGNK